jgi:dTDP-glucose 4,6-dehydratase/UDP-glucuronate decarboxylase
VNAAQREIVDGDLEAIAARVGPAFHQLEGARILVTGAASYITSYMADGVAWLNDHRFARPAQLLALVRSPVTPDSRLGHLLGRPDVRFIQQDVADPIDAGGPVDYVVHAASNASPRRYLASPLDTMDANVVGTRRLLELARASGARGFLFFSSSEVYGDVPDDAYPTPETYPGLVDATSPRACYAEAKRYGETLCLAFWRQHGVPVSVARVFFTYGPGLGLDDGRIMADLMRSRFANEPLRLFSDGRGVRAFSYTADSVAGFWMALLRGPAGEVFNVGSDQAVTVHELARRVARLEAPELEIVFPPQEREYLQGAPSRVCPDLGKARRMLGYAPAVGLDEGLGRWLRWLRAGAADPRC